jgi:hypothetical protein
MVFRMPSRVVAVLVAALLLVCPAWGHVGTANVFVQGKAGPYSVYVTITPPAVIPGEATISVITDGPDVQSVSVSANVLNGEATHSMPQDVALDAGPAGSHEFHGTAWIMTQGSWQIRFHVQGGQGTGSLSVPLPASATQLKHMSRSFGALLLVLGGVLIAGLASLAAAAVREATQPPGTEANPTRRALGLRAGAIAVLGVAVLLLLGNRLWKQEIARYSGVIYRPLQMTTAVRGSTLHLQLGTPKGGQFLFSNRSMDDLVLDHNHLMHLYVIRWPAMDMVYHLHPDQTSVGNFDLPLPSIPAGNYRLFADVVHADGFPDTAVADVYLDEQHGRPLAGDDASGLLPPITRPANAQTSISLPDGYRYKFAAVDAGASATSVAQQDSYQIRAKVPVLLHFTLLDANGDAPSDMANYMGMPGHAAILKHDGSVFAHIHPEGSVAMAAYMMANQQAVETSMGGMKMSGTTASLSNSTSFPFGFPTPGLYRVIVQMKHGNIVETGAVDLLVR